MRDGSLTKSKLERCALELFVRQGIASTTIKHIAQAANIAEGTLYRHYPSKEELASSLYINAYKDFSKKLHEALKSASTLKDQLSLICENVSTQYDSDPILFNYLLIAQHCELPKINQEEFSINKYLCDLIDKAVEKKELKQNDPNFYAAIILGILIQAAVARAYKRINRPMVEDSKKLNEALFGALGGL